MKEALDRFLRFLTIEKNASKHTTSAYRTDLEQFLAFFAKEKEVNTSEVSLSQIQRLTIRIWLGELSEQNLSKTSIARKIAALRSFFKFAYKRGLVEKNPAHLLMPPKKGKRLPKVVTESEVTSMFDHIDRTTHTGIQDAAILELFYSTGIRLSELVQLNVSDVDLASRQIKVMGKGSKERIVPFGKQARAALVAHLEQRTEFRTEKHPFDKDALFLSVSGKRIYPRAVQKMVRNYLAESSEVTQKSPHVLRHSFATHLLNNGAEIRVIKELLGHANLAATQIYTGTSVDHLKKIYHKAHPRAE